MIEGLVVDQGGVRGKDGKLINGLMVRQIQGSGAPTMTLKGSEEDETQDPLIRKPNEPFLPEYLTGD